MPKKNLKVLFASAELHPFAKAGGLADVAGSLPVALKKLGADVRVIMPKYGLIDEKKHKLKKILSDVKISSGGSIKKVNVFEGVLPGSKVKVYFIDNKKYFGKKEIYWDGNDPKKFISDPERFLFFSLACLHVLPKLKFKPDVAHAHDYHASLIIDLIKASNEEYFKNIKTILTIHNLNYQGKANPKVLTVGNLTKNSLPSLKVDLKDGDVNFFVQGIMNADVITTVSETYAKEIMTEKFGAGLENIIKKRKKDLYGVVNGLDIDFFNPSRDKNIEYNYSVKSLKKKELNKLYLQKKVGLPQDKNIPLVGFVSRLAWQKGIELIDQKFGELNCQFVFLGTGQKEYEEQLERMAKKYPNKVATNIMFDAKFANQIYAGSDIFLMPSRFEPCGLGQMIAMRYGAVPIVRATGGLKDTVAKFDNKNKKATGFVFNKFSSDALHRELKRALQIYHNDKKTWKLVQTQGMKQDFSWNVSARKYLKLYKKIIKK
ncbi:glycogen synthase [Candidatus Falkowbacteria bacterium]|jgi:starch synthase|nr:glycogen synthase [Candidatus Falkowbacteria bacterium]MBT4433201.1 glycogen synthase [Candidatus Falkowbacteria bacterium]